MKKNIHIIVLFFSVMLFAQQKPKIEADTLVTEYYIVKGDSVFKEAIDLDDVILLKKIKFNDRKEYIKYLILKRKTRKVYPYAKMAADKLTELTAELQKIKSKRKQKRYTKKVQKYLEEEFSAKLKKFTRTEGQILIKLIHRQTGKTAYNLVKELRSGWRAFWYNSTANLFNISLKEKYDPQNNKEDFYIEDILMRSFMDGVLEKQPHALDFDYFDLTNKWKPKPVPPSSGIQPIQIK